MVIKVVFKGFFFSFLLRACFDSLIDRKSTCKTSRTKRLGGRNRWTMFRKIRRRRIRCSRVDDTAQSPRRGQPSCSNVLPLILRYDKVRNTRVP